MEDNKELRKLKTIKETVEELSLSYAETLENFKGFNQCLKSTKSLWKQYDKSKLVKIGLTLIAFPEPTPISETIGASILALGLIKQKMNDNSLHIEDLYKTFHQVFRNLRELRENIVKY